MCSEDDAHFGKIIKAVEKLHLEASGADERAACSVSSTPGQGRRWRWAIHDKKKFEELLQQLSNFVSKLGHLTQFHCELNADHVRKLSTAATVPDAIIRPAMSRFAHHDVLAVAMVQYLLSAGCDPNEEFLERYRLIDYDWRDRRRLGESCW